MYCPKCGCKMDEGNRNCPNCDYVQENKIQDISIEKNQIWSSRQTTIKVLLIISCIICAFAIIPLIWQIPMTCSYCDKIKRGEKVGYGFIICTILFCNTLGGILMFGDADS